MIVSVFERLDEPTQKDCNETDSSDNSDAEDFEDETSDGLESRDLQQNHGRKDSALMSSWANFI